MDRPGQSPVEDLQSQVDFVGLDGDRRGDAEDAQAAAHDAAADQTSSPPRSGGEEGDPLQSNGVGEVALKKDEISAAGIAPTSPPALRAGPSLSPCFAGGEGA
jgi:hypothetical protein